MLHSPDKFKEDMPAQFDGIFEWDYLQGAFPRGIMPMDVDGSVEIKGNFLWYETKRHVGVAVPGGQMFALQAHVDQGHSVIIIWGKKKEDASKARLISPRADITVTKDVAQTVYQWSESWASWADINPYYRTLGNGFRLTESRQLEHLAKQCAGLLTKYTPIVISYKVPNQQQWKP